MLRLMCVRTKRHPRVYPEVTCYQRLQFARFACADVALRWQHQLSLRHASLQIRQTQKLTCIFLTFRESCLIEITFGLVFSDAAKTLFLAPVTSGA